MSIFDMFLDVYRRRSILTFSPSVLVGKLSLAPKTFTFARISFDLWGDSTFDTPMEKDVIEWGKFATGLNSCEQEIREILDIFPKVTVDGIGRPIALEKLKAEASITMTNQGKYTCIVEFADANFRPIVDDNWKRLIKKRVPRGIWRDIAIQSLQYKSYVSSQNGESIHIVGEDVANAIISIDFEFHIEPAMNNRKTKKEIIRLTPTERRHIIALLKLAMGQALAEYAKGIINRLEIRYIYNSEPKSHTFGLKINDKRIIEMEVEKVDARNIFRKWHRITQAVNSEYMKKLYSENEKL